MAVMTATGWALRLAGRPSATSRQQACWRGHSPWRSSAAAWRCPASSPTRRCSPRRPPATRPPACCCSPPRGSGTLRCSGRAAGSGAGCSPSCDRAGGVQPGSRGGVAARRGCRPRRAVASVPVVLAVVAPLMDGRRPSPVVLAAALVVTAGAAMVQGVGRSGWASVSRGSTRAGLRSRLHVAGRATAGAPRSVGRLGPHDVAGRCALAAAAACTRDRRPCWTSAGDTPWPPDIWLSASPPSPSCSGTPASAAGRGRAGLLTGRRSCRRRGHGHGARSACPRPLVWLGIAIVAAGLVLGPARCGPGSTERAAGEPAPPRPGRRSARVGRHWRRRIGSMRLAARLNKV
jgi:hypothetical protein